MSLEDAVAHMAELRTTADCLFAIGEVGNMAHAVNQLITLRNRTVGLSPEAISQRQAILDLNIRLLKAELKKAMRERLIPALQEWEKYE